MAKVQILAILIAAMSYLAPANAADQRQYLLFVSESRTTDPAEDVGESKVSAAGIEWRGGRNEGIGYAGITIGKMTSEQTISAFGDRNIGYPMFLHFGINIPAVFAPYIEFGVDLGAAIFNEGVEGEDANTDQFVAGGLAIQTKAILLKFYAKEYRLKPYGLEPVDVYVTGASIGLEF